MLLLPQGPGIATARALRKLACLTLAVLLPVGMALAATDTQQIERGRY
ncbi:alcohol dehydrogenase, partial [Pseudomonas sp. GW460-13]